MKIRTRLAVFLLLIALAFYVLTDRIMKQLPSEYLSAMEESMLDTATVLASFVELDAAGQALGTGELRQAFDLATRKRFSAMIYEYRKTSIDMRVYVADANGKVVYDSTGADEGKDFSRWNDVARTLRGEYGARATRLVTDDPMTSTLYVAAPIKAREPAGERIVGVLTVAKPTKSIAAFLLTARGEIAAAGFIIAMAVLALGAVFSMWVTTPIERLTKYARDVRDGKRAVLPKMGKGEIGALGAAFEDMRVALEGKKYVEHYVESLTHQMKSPLSAIHGAVELLREDMPPGQRAHFIQNLRHESDRLQDLINRMLQLSELESRNELRDVGDIDVAQLVDEVCASIEPAMQCKQLSFVKEGARPVTIQGEPALVRDAVMNLVQNAIDFSPRGGTIKVSAGLCGDYAEITVLDHGQGIPPYAETKVFDRFFSLPRPDNGRKSSGLGLVFVKEAAQLHHGAATIENAPDGGAKATLRLPVTRVSA